MSETLQQKKSRIKQMTEQIRYDHRDEDGDAGMDWLLEMAAKGMKVENGEYKTVVHAHWFEKSYEGPRCSNCGKYALEDGSEGKVKSDYCPYCGALMDAKK